MVAHSGKNLPVCYIRYFPEELRLTIIREILVQLWRIVWQYALINETDYTQNHIQKVNRKQSNRSLKSGWTLKLSDGVKTTKWAYLICIFYSDVLVRSFFHSENSLHIKAFSHFSEIRMFLERNPKCKLNCGLSFFFFFYQINNLNKSYCTHIFTFDDFTKGVHLVRGRDSAINLLYAFNFIRSEWFLSLYVFINLIRIFSFSQSWSVYVQFDKLQLSIYKTAPASLWSQ